MPVTTTDLLADAFERIREAVHRVVDGATPDDLTYRADPDANTVAWLVWHLARIQDDHIADVAGTEQVWSSRGWAERFGLPPGTTDTGYGHDRSQVATVTVGSAELLTDYYDSVHERTLRFLKTVTDADLERIVDRRWDPAVTLAVRLVSVIADDLQHAGQAAYVRGLSQRRR